MENFSKQPLGKYLSGLGKCLLHALNEKLSTLDLDRNFFALILIQEGNGTLTQQDLAVLLESDKVSVVRIIDYLSEKGYVKRVKETSDRRKYRLKLTDKARDEMPLIKAAIADITQTALNGLSPDKIEELYSTLAIIKNNLN